MTQIVIPPLRKSTTQIPDRPRSPPRFAPYDISFAIPGRSRHPLHEMRSRPCREATLVLELCKDGPEQLSDVERLMTTLPEWVVPDFLKHGLRRGLAVDELEVARFFLERGAVLDEEVVFEVVREGKRGVEMFELFVEFGWGVNGTKLGGMTVLGLVVDDKPLVRWLLSKNADPNFGRPQSRKLNAMEADHESGFALDRAAYQSSIIVFDMLLKAGAKIEYSAPLHAAIGSSKPDNECFSMMEYLLSLGLDIDATDHKVKGLRGQGSPLMCIVRRGSAAKIERMRWLLEHGANPGRENWRGTSPVDEARRWGNRNILEIFAEFCPLIKETEGL